MPCTLPLGEVSATTDELVAPVRAIGPEGELVAMAEISRAGAMGVLQPRVVLPR